ncbi:hypothetical protein LTR78_003947 [Recurvomyces mirabilis]|uniref:Large ribosomal subunit protein mL46 n=1 Tax=Recurvomyces mirabilis TaxID=574656 RepID=A0AAE1C386_9PEZI|nr:hypothetical protein LTR78_003947 [Recurvomyces mirabilis]KAK5153915.1 hypothetical protein LTS14_007135 [Recurvomyces mirabilis]
MAGTVLSRPPQLTRDLTSFEKAFYLYQKRLNERLAMPFSRYFYYNKGTPADPEWKRKFASRKTPSRDIGVYDAYGDEGWNDEVLVGDQTGERESVVESLIRDAEGKSIVEEAEKDKGAPIAGDPQIGEGQRREAVRIEVERPQARLTEADRSGDEKSLNRKLDRTLYLIVKNGEGRWRFPEDRIYGRENLHQAAERILVQSCGINMNTWLVGNHPIGQHTHHYPSTSGPITSLILANPLVGTSKEMEREEYGEKLFFMKARIMAGQPELKENAYGLKEWAWLAKEEVEKKVGRGYWSSVRNMLAER